ncbi:hypothetical protein Mapa_013481 [Marchantia paleacea]|nr:hypothetical protein Mapa_013481 [Marchantia paleacea]
MRTSIIFAFNVAALCWLFHAPGPAQGTVRVINFAQNTSLLVWNKHTNAVVKPLNSNFYLDMEFASNTDSTTTTPPTNLFVIKALKTNQIITRQRIADFANVTIQDTAFGDVAVFIV